MNKYKGNIKIKTILVLACISMVLCACTNEGGTENIDPSEGIGADQKNAGLFGEIAASSKESAAWQRAYLEIICNMQEYLVDIDDFRSNPELYNPMDEWVYLGIHDFNGDNIPELLVGDSLTMAVFTFTDGKPEKIADLYDEYDPSSWCINGVYFKDNSVSLDCDGSGGCTFVNFGYLESQYVIGHYSEINLPSVVRINGEECTLEYMNRIYSTHFTQRETEELRERIHLVNEDGIWKLKFQSGEEAVLNAQFDFELILWERTNASDDMSESDMPLSELTEKTEEIEVESIETISDLKELLFGGLGNLGLGFLAYTVPDRDNEDYRLYFFKSENVEDRYRSFEEMSFNLSEASFVFPDVREGNVPIGKFKELYFMDYTDVLKDGACDVIVIAIYEKDGNEYYDTRVYEEGEKGFVVNVALTQELNEKYYNVENYPIEKIISLPGDH